MLQCWFCVSYLEVWAGHTFSELSEERLLDFDELRRLNDVQDLLQLVQEHHLLRTVSLWPELQETHYHLKRRRHTRQQVRQPTFNDVIVEKRGLTGSVRLLSFSKNWTTQYANCRRKGSR